MDTICAIATPLGESAIGAIRVSGGKAIPIVDEIFEGRKKLVEMKSHTVQYGKIIDPESRKIVDEVIVTVMKAPHTYTTENMVEVFTHGSVVILKKVLSLILNRGARLAKAGEFTYRALINGRIDLIQAEAVNEIVKAKSETQLAVAMSQLTGKFKEEVEKVKEKLINIKAKIEGMIDFPEDVVEEGIENEIEEVKEKVERIVKEGEEWEQIKEGIVIPIIGHPNVGKSTLFNAIVKEEKAIVTPYPGTTRDIIEGLIELDGFLVKFVDTAGVRKSEHLIEKEGIKRTKEVIKKSKIVIFMLDKSRGIVKEDWEIFPLIKDKEIIGVLNKKDLVKKNIKLPRIPFNLIEISALKKEGIREVIKEVTHRLSKINSPVVMGNWRQIQLMKEVRKGLQRIRNNLMTLEVMAYEINNILKKINYLTGEDISEEVLERIFSQFCIGK
jgi:tRNA modification GTPase